MPATSFRPAQLNLSSCNQRSYTRAVWAPGSDSEEDETTSADSNEDAEADDDEHCFDGPSDGTAAAAVAAHTAPIRTAPALPSIQVPRPQIRSAPTSPLAVSSSSGFPPRPPRGLGMSPLSPTGRPSVPGLKATPLARTLLNRSMPGAAPKPKKTTKFIVPKTAVRTTFELGLTSQELARKK